MPSPENMTPLQRKWVCLLFIISFPLVHGNASNQLGIYDDYGDLYGSYKCDFGENGRFFVSYGIKVPPKWYATSPVPLEYSHSFHDEAEIHPVYVGLVLHVHLFDEDGDLTFHGEKVIFHYKSELKDYYHDQFWTPTTWNLSQAVTSILSGTLWTGHLFMNTSLSLDSQTYGNTSDIVEITYQYQSTQSTDMEIFQGLLSVIVLGLIFSGIRKKIRETQ